MRFKLLFIGILFFSQLYGQQNVKVLDYTSNTYSSGSSFYVAIGTQMQVTGTWTFEGWLYVDSRSSGTYPVIMDRRTVFSWFLINGVDGGDYAVRFVARDNNDNIIASLRCDGTNGSTATQMYFDKWYHIAVSRDGTEGIARLFINGNQKDSSNDPDFVLSTPSGNAINYGARYWGGYERYLDGSLDEMHMSDIARYTSNFTISKSSPPQTADEHTVLLFNFDNSDLTNSATKNSYIATAHGNQTFSDWDALNDDLSLPVELTTFSAFFAGHAVLLQWQTASEVENLGFIIERALQKDGPFNAIASYRDVPSLKGAGNSSQGHHYSYSDQTIQPGTNYWYRLQDVSLNGNRQTHGPIFVATVADNSVLQPRINQTVPRRFKLYANYPNPFNPDTRIKLDIPQNKDGNITLKAVIFDVSGRQVRSLYTGAIQAGTYQLHWDGKDNAGRQLGSGVYILSVKAGTYYNAIKMTLMR